jgi:uncharacterized membrane protein
LKLESFKTLKPEVVVAISEPRSVGTPPSVQANGSAVRSTEPEKGSRIVALDMTKGVLVVFMVIYHSLNYTTEYYLAFRYMAFLPPSFILIVGFLLSSVYSVRYDVRDLRLRRRLIARGVKLILLFTLLNIAALISRGQPVRNLELFFEHFPEIYVAGAGRFAAFEILLPIGYLLVLAPLLLLITRAHRVALPLIAVSVFGTCVLLDANGLSSLNLNLLGAGLLGIVLGRFPLTKLDLLRRFWPISLLLYCSLFAADTASGHTYVFQVMSACAALALIYGLCARFDAPSWPQQRLLRLGQYSLVSYIFQIAVLQILVRLFGRPEAWSVEFFVLLFGTLVLMTVLVECVEWARTQSAGIQTLYKAVFA